MNRKMFVRAAIVGSLALLIGFAAFSAKNTAVAADRETHNVFGELGTATT